MTIDFKALDKQVAAAIAGHKARMADVASARAVHRDKLEALEAARGELQALEAIIAEFETDMESDITVDQYQAAVDAITAARVLAGRAQVAQKRASHNWQDAERSAVQDFKARQRAILAEFDAAASAARDQYYQRLQGAF